jgi:hypothetical protein
VLVVELCKGDIEVVADSSRAIEVHATKYARGDTEREARESVRKVNVSVVQEGDTVRVNVRAAAGLEQARPEASVRVRVPPGTCLELRTDKGTITVTGKTGKVRLQGTGVRVS